MKKKTKKKDFQLFEFLYFWDFIIHKSINTPPKKKKNKKKKLVDVCCRFALSVLKAKDDEFRQKTERLAAARTSLFFVLTASLTYVSKFSLPQILTRGIENRWALGSRQSVKLESPGRMKKRWGIVE
jgi:hypothetical protein